MPRWKLAILSSPPKACIGRLCTRESRSGEGQGRRADGGSRPRQRAQSEGRSRQAKAGEAGQRAYLGGSLKDLWEKEAPLWYENE